MVGLVVDPEGQPVADAWVLGRPVLRPDIVEWNFWRGDYHRNAFNGRFELHGLDPDKEVPIFVLEPKRKLGAVAQVSGRSAAGGSVTIRLEPCGTARVRIVNPDGRPISAYRDNLMIAMVVTPVTRQWWAATVIR